MYKHRDCTKMFIFGMVMTFHKTSLVILFSQYILAFQVIQQMKLGQNLQSVSLNLDFNLLSLFWFSLRSQYMKPSIEFKIIKLLRRMLALLVLELMSYNIVRNNPAETKRKILCVGQILYYCMIFSCCLKFTATGQIYLC